MHEVVVGSSESLDEPPTWFGAGLLGFSRKEIAEMFNVDEFDLARVGILERGAPEVG